MNASFKILSILLLVFSPTNGFKYLNLSKVNTNIDITFNHIKQLKMSRNDNILGFHHYRISDNNIQIIEDDIKICKINDNLWVITKKRPYQFHQGFVSYISPENIQFLDIKNFFPCAWTDNTLQNKILSIIKNIKLGNFYKINGRAISSGYTWMIHTTFKKKIIRLIVTYDNIKKQITPMSLYPINDKNNEDTEIPGKTIFKIMADQRRNLSIIANQ